MLCLLMRVSSKRIEELRSKLEEVETFNYATKDNTGLVNNVGKFQLRYIIGRVNKKFLILFV
jgi:hypothetical protein